MTDELQILTLLLTPRIGLQAIRLVMHHFSEQADTVEDLHEMLQSLQAETSRINVPEFWALRQAQDRARAVLDDATSLGIKVLTSQHPHFPKRFLALKNCPVAIYAKGATDCLNEPATVAIIGTREPSEYGSSLAEKFGSMFAKRNFVVVSGLALGCDTQAHTGCLRVGGRTVAVMAHGLSTVYPAKNRDLAAQILDTGGCLLSEYQPREKARPAYFVDRDRLQSGLSAGVVVVETDIKGGTMHTVRFCGEQGRELACLNHPPKFRAHPKANGNRYLIDSGQAFPISTPCDVDKFITQMVFKGRVPNSLFEAEIADSLLGRSDEIEDSFDIVDKTEAQRDTGHVKATYEPNKVVGTALTHEVQEALAVIPHHSTTTDAEERELLPSEIAGQENGTCQEVTGDSETTGTLPLQISEEVHKPEAASKPTAAKKKRASKRKRPQLALELAES